MLSLYPFVSTRVQSATLKSFIPVGLSDIVAGLKRLFIMSTREVDLVIAGYCCGLFLVSSLVVRGGRE